MLLHHCAEDIRFVFRNNYSTHFHRIGLLLLGKPKHTTVYPIVAVLCIIELTNPYAKLLVCPTKNAWGNESLGVLLRSPS